MNEIIEEMFTHMKTQIKHLALANSRFVFDGFLFLDVNFHQLKLTRGSSYLPLPDWIANKKAVINPQNEAGWKNDLSVNVLGIEGGEEKLYILGKSRFNGQRTANLLLIDQEWNRHYATIKNLSRLLASSNSEHQQHLCLNCLQEFHSQESRDKHHDYCVDNEAVRIDMPEENSFVRSHSGQYQFKAPFIICTDFEANFQSLEEETELYPEAPYMKRINCHVTFGFCTYSTCAYGEVKDPLRFYRGKDCVEVFCNHIESEAKRLDHMFRERPMKRLTQEQ